MSGSIGINFGHLKIGTCDICVSNQVHRARCHYNTGCYNESQFINQVSSESNPEVYTIFQIIPQVFYFVNQKSQIYEISSI